MEERNLDSWEEFEEQVVELHSDPTVLSSNDGPLLFRGQENSCWPLQTTLQREQGRERMLFTDYYRVISKIRAEVDGAPACMWNIPTCEQVQGMTRGYDFMDMAFWSKGVPTPPVYAYMAYLRHHGFPSPLLDWTRSPEIAAFFAFGNATPQSSGKVSIYAFTVLSDRVLGNEIALLHRSGIEFGPSAHVHLRHERQQSEYTLCVSFAQDLWRFDRYDRVFDSGRYQQGKCWKFNLPVSERLRVLRLLDERDINARRLFDSTEGLMHTLTIRELYPSEP